MSSDGYQEWRLLGRYLATLCRDVGTPLLSKLPGFIEASFPLRLPAKIESQGDVADLFEALQKFDEAHGPSVSVHLMSLALTEAKNDLRDLRKSLLKKYSRKFQMGMLALSLCLILFIVGSLVLAAGGTLVVNGIALGLLIIGMVAHDAAQKTVFALMIIDDNLSMTAWLQGVLEQIRLHPDGRDELIHICHEEFDRIYMRGEDREKYFALK